jgi:cold-inducible RNA-binding protein
MAQKLFVGGISFSTTSEGLREFFEQSGTVLSASVVTDKFTGESRGFGFVEMGSSEEANQAVSQLNGRELDGRQLKVEVAKPRTDGPRGAGDRRGGGGGGRGGFRGGWR